VEAVLRGLRVPLVYNSSGYDSVASLKGMNDVKGCYKLSIISPKYLAPLKR
jgi:hypothetical protein